MIWIINVGKYKFFLLLLLLFSDVRWVPFHDYPSQNDALIYDTHGNRVGRLNTEIGYVIGKIEKHSYKFHAAYRGIHSKSSGRAPFGCL